VLRAILVAYFIVYVTVRAYYSAKTGTLTERPKGRVLPKFI